MKSITVGLAKTFILFIILIISCNTYSQTIQDIESNRITLPNGWKLTPVGKQLPLGDLPLNMTFSSSGRLLAVTNNGEGDQTIMLFNTVTRQLLDTFLLGKAWLGLSFSKDEKSLYVSGGNDNCIIHFSIIKDKLIPKDTIVLGKPWPELISVSGITINEDQKILYAVTKEDNSMYVADLQTNRIIAKYSLGAEAYTCLLAKNNRKLYISSWGGHQILVFDTQRKSFDVPIEVGSNPNDMCITQNGKILFVANSNDNSVSVINLSINKVIETLNTALYPDAPTGSTANSVAVGKDDKTLYIANADNNCLSVFDISHPGNSTSKGFIPTAWYPTCVRTSKNNIYVSNGKGLNSLANPFGPNPFNEKEQVIYQHGLVKKTKKVQYIASLFQGALSIFPAPNETQLSIFSQVVYHNTPYSKEKETHAEGAKGNPIPMELGAISPIKYVFYIIKENRTYDQILGDLPNGNGDTSLVLFGEKVTPNQHALAKEFALLDNFYVDAEVSADGHNWSCGAYATDYLEKTWPTSYGGRGGKYDAEGLRAIANNKKGFIWDYCFRAGVTYRTYGEFTTNYKPNIPVLKNHLCPYFTGWDQKVRDTTRYSQWKQEFDSLLAKGNVPHFNSLRFINDHTEGLKSGRPTPFAAVADNDLAVGLFVDHLSHSPIWNQSVVFIVEDDAQNGPDHVDAHRSTLYLAGGMVRKGFTDHTIYSTSSVLHTIEMILGLPPMSQYDAAATTLWRCFNDSVIHPNYVVRQNQIDLNEKNKVINQWSERSNQFDFSKEDLAPENEMNKVIWVAVKENEDIPSPVHAAFVHKISTDED